MKLLFLVAALALLAPFSPKANAARPAFDGFEEATEMEERGLRKIGNLKPTFYWVAMEEEDGRPRNRALKDMSGKVLAMVSAKFYADIRMEGTGKMLDGRVLNYAGRVRKGKKGWEVRYMVCPPEAPYGYGVNNIPLIPFRSVAVDPRVVPMGSKVFIPQAVGAVLPDGSVHDGMFRAVDVGDAIKNHRIDVFTAFGDQSAVFAAVGFVNMRAAEVFLVGE